MNNIKTLLFIFIGINDKGENTGIPILNYMNSTIINNLFYSALYKHILNFYKFSKYVTIDIIPLTINIAKRIPIATPIKSNIYPPFN